MGRFESWLDPIVVGILAKFRPYMLEEEDGHRRIRWLFGRKKAVLPSVIVGGPNWCGVRQLSRSTSVLGVGPKSFSLGVWAGPPIEYK
jgi:hypothetical protein